MVDALNVGGGAVVLLNHLSRSLCKANLNHVVLAPSFVKLPSSGTIPASVRNPISNQRVLSISDTLGRFGPSNLLSFGNIPIRKVPGIQKQFTYFHNALLLPHEKSFAAPLINRIRYWVIRQVIKNRIHQSDFWLVQSKTIRQLFIETFAPDPSSVLVMPFFPLDDWQSPQTDKSEAYDLVYIGSHATHKNHINLLRALRRCAENNVFPHLAVTCDLRVRSDLRGELKACRKKGVRVTELGQIPYDRVLSITNSARAVIFPSIVESLGLGLVEAAAMNKIVLASDRAWVHESIEPSLTFEPNSPESIAKAITEVASVSNVPCAKLRIKDHTSELIALLKS